MFENIKNKINKLSEDSKIFLNEEVKKKAINGILVLAVIGAVFSPTDSVARSNHYSNYQQYEQTKEFTQNKMLNNQDIIYKLQETAKNYNQVLVIDNLRSDAKIYFRDSNKGSGNKNVSISNINDRAGNIILIDKDNNRRITEERNINLNEMYSVLMKLSDHSKGWKNHKNNSEYSISKYLIENSHKNKKYFGGKYGSEYSSSRTGNTSVSFIIEEGVSATKHLLNQTVKNKQYDNHNYNYRPN